MSKPLRDTGTYVRRIRVCRALSVLLIPWNVLSAVVGTGLWQATAITAVLFLLTVIGFETFAVGRLEKMSGRHYPLTEPLLRRIAHRPRRVMIPEDYERQWEFERELGWEPSEPCMPVKMPASPVMTAEHARRLTLSAAGSVSYSALSGSGSMTASARCGGSDSGNVVYYTGTAAATASQYARWLRGYVKNGGKITHWYDYPFARAGFRFAASTVTVDSDYEYGARARNIIIARNVPTKRTRPTAAFGGWAHTKCYWMHGNRTSDPHFVAAYSDPEFDEFRQEDIS